jgi:hypothetical protein
LFAGKITAVHHSDSDSDTNDNKEKEKGKEKEKEQESSHSTYDIAYDDGDKELRVPSHRISTIANTDSNELTQQTKTQRVTTASTVNSGSGSGGSSGSSGSGSGGSGGGSGNDKKGQGTAIAAVVKEGIETFAAAVVALAGK